MAKGKVYIAGQLVGMAAHEIVLEALKQMGGEVEYRKSGISDSVELHLDMLAAKSAGGEFLLDLLAAER